MKKIALYTLVGGAALVLGLGTAWMRQGQQQSLIAEANAATLPAQAGAAGLWQSGFNDLQGKPQAFAQWRGKPLVVNFWATWCAPCREEMPEFVATQKKLGDKVRFVGLAIDNPADVQKFVKEFGINYPVLVGEQAALELMRAEGNKVGALPFTAIYDSKGKRVAAHAGRLDQAKLDAYLKPLI
ncbi:TlpA family protein disulfide reductase [Chitinimonas sp. JJ19]|uniref:TlpA family protein disulfide reductase n=1 Tax=Chitinimonas sp. JJ19 TaxID=3109352 RepID=UPI002FFE694F